MLNTVLPVAFVAGAVCPVHFTVAVAFILFVAATILVTRLPGEEAQT